MPTIKLVSSDGETFKVDVKIAMQSRVLSTIIISKKYGSNDGYFFTLVRVDAAILKKVN